MTSADLRSGSDSLRGRPYVSIAEFPFVRRRASPAEEAVRRKTLRNNKGTRLRALVF